MQLVSGHFISVYDPTIEELFKTSIAVDGEVVSLEIMDIAGLYCYDTNTFIHIRNSDGYIIVYSITSMTSFFYTNRFREQLYRELEKEMSEHIPIALVGNKCDL